MEEKKIELNDKKNDNIFDDFIEDNNLNLFLDDTVDLNVVVEKVKENE